MHPVLVMVIVEAKVILLEEVVEATIMVVEVIPRW
jgi:hypothetical protein